MSNQTLYGRRRIRRGCGGAICIFCAMINELPFFTRLVWSQGNQPGGYTFMESLILGIQIAKSSHAAILFCAEQQHHPSIPNQGKTI